jgi:TRAP-type C4-dicarboxylate transport system substrate-binding protein
MKRSVYFLLAIFLLGCFCFGIHSAFAEPKVLKAVSMVPKHHPFHTPQEPIWIDRINEALKGELQIKLVGGPEVIPPGEQIEAVRNNMVQISFLPTSYYKHLIREGVTMQITQYKDVTEMREKGYIDWLNKRHEKIGIRVVAVTYWGGFNFWSKEPIKRIADFKGKRFRSNATYDVFQRALGLSPVSIHIAEIYTALERGVVEGLAFPLMGVRVGGLTKHIKYAVGHSFFSMDKVCLMNLDTWNNIPKPAQDKIQQITLAYEPEMMKLIVDRDNKEWGLLEKEGLTRTYFSPDEEKKFLEMAYQSIWNDLKKKLPADVIQESRKFVELP